MNMNVFCPNCGFTVGEQIGGKLALGATAALVGSRVNLAVALITGLIGVWIGHNYIDRAIRTCPQCGTVMRIAAALI